MTNKYAKELAETITNKQLLSMLSRAANEVKDWSKPSKSNKGLSRGINWNMFCKDFDVSIKYASIRKYRMLQEFGEFLTEDLKQVKKRKPECKAVHFDPDLTKFI